MQENKIDALPSQKSLLKQRIKENHPDFRYYKSLFNLTSNLVAITEGDTIIDANKAFVDFFKTINLDIFEPTFTLSAVFEKIDKYDYIYDGYLNKRWFEFTDKADKEHYRVAINGSDELYNFCISIKKFEFSQSVFVVILTDITQLIGYKNSLEFSLSSISKNKEETEFLLAQYNNAIDISNLVIKIDMNGNITYANDAFCKVLKYTQQELTNQNIKIFYNPNATYGHYTSIVQAMKNGDTYKGVIENIDKVGGTHFFNATIVPIKNQQSVTIEYLFIQNEITEMVKAKESALQALEEKSRFFDKVSHELRTPLNAIINFTEQSLEMYDEIFEDEESRELVQLYLQRAYKNSNNLLNLINSLLDLSKLKSAKEQFHIGVHDIVEIVNESYESCSGLNIKEGVTYKLILDCESGFVQCDYFKLNQMIINLISNAFKFTQKGFVTICLSQRDDNYIIEVKDSGVGIPQEKLVTIFEPFEQARSSDAGTGLGLSIVKEYANIMNIAINVTSSQGSGSCFELKIKKFII